MLTDVNTWLGNWPFQKFEINTPGKLAKHLKAEGISHAFVSSLDSVFLPDPDQGNKVLLSELKKYPCLYPVMIIDLSLDNWKELLEKYRNLNIKLIKLVPNYHGYSLLSPCVKELMRMLGAGSILPVIQVRLEDERTQHKMCKVPGVEVKDIVKCANKFPYIEMIVCGAYYTEALELVRETKNLYIEISFIEKFDTIRSLLKEIPAKRILFGSHTPFFYTRSSVMKIKAPGINENDRRLIMNRKVI